jgi:hypothetical protein
MMLLGLVSGIERDGCGRIGFRGFLRIGYGRTDM